MLRSMRTRESRIRRAQPVCTLAERPCHPSNGQPTGVHTGAKGQPCSFGMQQKTLHQIGRDGFQDCGIASVRTELVSAWDAKFCSRCFALEATSPPFFTDCGQAAFGIAPVEDSFGRLQSREASPDCRLTGLEVTPVLAKLHSLQQCK